MSLYRVKVVHRSGCCKRNPYGDVRVTYGDAFDDAVAMIKKDLGIVSAYIQIKRKEFWAMESVVVVESVRKALAMDEPVKCDPYVARS